MGHLISTGSCPFCNSGNNTPCFATYSDGYKCFSCGKQKNDAKYDFQQAVIIPKNPQLIQLTSNVCEFSNNVLQWLYNYYIFEKEIKAYNIYYTFTKDKTEESLVFYPNVKPDSTFWQQRFFPSKRFLTFGNKQELQIMPNIGSKLIVLVEDYISAIRVNEYANVLCLWGVHVTHHMLKVLQNFDMSIAIWLDPDRAGREASRLVLSRLNESMHYCSKYKAFANREPRTVAIVETDEQPKNYSGFQIGKILKEYI